MYSTKNADWKKFTVRCVQEICGLKVLDIIKDASVTTDSIDKAVDLLTLATQTACRTTLKILSPEIVRNNNHSNNNKNLP